MGPLTTYLIETFVTLVAVLALAFLILMGAKRFGIGQPIGPITLVGRLPLDTRRAVYLVRVANQVIILGSSEAGLCKLGEVQEQHIEDFKNPQTQPRFSDLIARFRQSSRRVSQGSTVLDNDHG
jgi:flagellar biogenesis protein FliO